MALKTSVMVLFLAAASLCWCAQRYEGKGLVVNVDMQHHTLLVSHEAIPGYMDAMVMPWHFDDTALLATLRPGTPIDFTLIVTETSSSLTSVRVHPYDSVERDPEQNKRLKILDSAMHADRSVQRPIAAGETVPDFSLVDQAGRPVSLSQFRGRTVAITFIYTRCPLPDYCLRLTNNFGRLQKRFRDRLGRELVLLSVTFDPNHDRPDVLAKYAAVWGGDGESWRFLTGSLAEVKRVCGVFGMNFWQDEGLLTHSLHTAIIDSNGALVANIEGNQFSVEQLGDLIEAAMSRTPHHEAWRR